MVDKWLDEIKQRANPEDLGMIMVHNGIVRGTSKSGRPVQGMKLSYEGDQRSLMVFKEDHLQAIGQDSFKNLFFEPGH